MSYDTIEQKLQALADCGLKLKEQFGIDNESRYYSAGRRNLCPPP